jgi:phosphoenolpyruvate carboxylase
MLLLMVLLMVALAQATPEMEYGRMNIGSRPSKRKPSGGIESLRAIPWIFAWTQTRFHLPVWLGLGGALKQVLEADQGNMSTLSRMYDQWPFFRVTIDLVEMVFAKGDPRIAELYDTLLVKEELQPFGEELRRKYNETKNLLLKVPAVSSPFISSVGANSHVPSADFIFFGLDVADCKAY